VVDSGSAPKSKTESCQIKLKVPSPCSPNPSEQIQKLSAGPVLACLSITRMSHLSDQSLITAFTPPSTCSTVGVPHFSNPPLGSKKCDVYPQCCQPGWQPEGFSWSVSPGRCPSGYGYFTNPAYTRNDVRTQAALRMCCRS
jgi:hypothetical protein